MDSQALSHTNPLDLATDSGVKLESAPSSAELSPSLSLSRLSPVRVPHTPHTADRSGLRQSAVRIPRHGTFHYHLCLLTPGKNEGKQLADAGEGRTDSHKAKEAHMSSELTPALSLVLLHFNSALSATLLASLPLALPLPFLNVVCGWVKL